jgi:hypothetical protein
VRHRYGADFREFREIKEFMKAQTWVLVGYGEFLWVLVGSCGFLWVLWVLVGSCAFWWELVGLAKKSPLEPIRT